ncbi:MAG: Cold-shock DNA-binding domain [Pseudomonadota bacterium]|jgi:cold shock CspA family protein
MSDFFKGKISEWNYAKGYGFISYEENHQIKKVFVHISSFKNTITPKIGEII